MTRVRVTQVLAREPERILFGGTVIGGPADGKDVSFHIRLPHAEAAATAIANGQTVEVGIPA